MAFASTERSLSREVNGPFSLEIVSFHAQLAACTPLFCRYTGQSVSFAWPLLLRIDLFSLILTVFETLLAADIQVHLQRKKKRESSR